MELEEQLARKQQDEEKAKGRANGPLFFFIFFLLIFTFFLFFLFFFFFLFSSAREATRLKFADKKPPPKSEGARGEEGENEGEDLVIDYAFGDLIKEAMTKVKEEQKHKTPPKGKPTTSHHHHFEDGTV